VVAAYFNPAGYKRRLQNYRAFRRNLDAPLLTVELAKPGAHELGDGDADILVSLTGEDGIWQKERLINIGVARLPDHVRYVAWIDADLIFDDAGWPAAAKARLDESGGMVQLFDTVAHQDRDLDPQAASPEVCRELAPLFSGVSLTRALRDGVFEANETKLSEALPAWGTQRYYGLIDRHTVYGMAWAARRDVLAACGHFDKSVVGGGDAVQVTTALGKLDVHLNSRNFTAKHRAAALAWAGNAREAGLFRHISSIDQRACHLWHGDFPDRGYRKRYGILAEHDFDPARDLRLADNGTWAWADPNGVLAADVEAYFYSRFEDGRG
jgi:hypothetical protein